MMPPAPGGMMAPPRPGMGMPPQPGGMGFPPQPGPGGAAPGGPGGPGRLDPDKMPSPIQVMDEDQKTYEGTERILCNFFCLFHSRLQKHHRSKLEVDKNLPD